jgi:hypothetical protein
VTDRIRVEFSYENELRNEPMHGGPRLSANGTAEARKIELPGRSDQLSAIVGRSLDHARMKNSGDALGRSLYLRVRIA